MYRRFYSVNDMPVLQNKSSAASATSKQAIKSPKQNTGKGNPFENILHNFEADDIILAIIIFALLMDDCDDLLLLLALGFIFLT